MSTLGLVLNDILIQARKNKASDVHISAGSPVIFRLGGQLKKVSEEALNAEQVRSLITKALPLETVKTFDATGDAEYVHTIPNNGRFRMTLMKQREGWELTVRLIPMGILKPETIGLPPACTNLTKWTQGLVLITGPAGCGKTSTLASLVEIINQNRHEHIITIEQPIEIIYAPQKCQITQREVGAHTASQHTALRAALREDPDILVVSELRDLQTIQLAVTAAETGHLVFGTMNTVNAAQTVSRLIDSFPSDEQSVMRNMISESLRGVICQQLIPRKDGTGMVAAFEILIVNHSIANLIREGNIYLLNNSITTGKSFGMQLMDTSLQGLVAQGLIATKDAAEHATNPAQFLQMV